MPQEPSTSQVNKAGKLLRRHARGELVGPSDYEDAYEVLLAFRASHVLPLTSATMGLRSMVASEGCKVEVSQRLKRVPTIIEKLHRQPTMALAKMQDIGGCRSILDSIDEVRRVQRRLVHRRPPKDVDDYIAAPPPSGYRGVHVIVEYRGRHIEIQLRTQNMHDWAIQVERLGGWLQQDLKSGEGPPEVLELFGAISEAMALEETGQTVDADLMARLARAREGAVGFLPGGPR